MAEKDRLPHNDLMEEIVLGAIMAGHKQSAELLDTLRPDDFLDTRNRKVLRCIQDLNTAGVRPSLLAVNDELDRTGEINDAGEIAHISKMVDGIAIKSDVLQAVRVLRRMSGFRQAAHLAENIRLLALEQSADLETLLDSAVEKYSNLARDLESTDDDGSSYFDSASRALATANKGARLKLYTDVNGLDELTGGFREGELVVMTAETGTGKSLFAAQIRARACRDGYFALFCSGEMSNEHLASRELATQSGVDPMKMRRDDTITEDDYKALTRAAAHQCKKCRILDGELSLPRIRRAARKMKARTGLDLLILDYDELIDAEGKTEFEQQRVIARAAKSLAIELKCVVVLISQLRKTNQGEDAGNPTLQRLYGSGAKQKFASFIILADRPFVRKLEGDEKQAELRLLKSRDGRTGRIQATFNIRTLRFEDAPQNGSGSVPEALTAGLGRAA